MTVDPSMMGPLLERCEPGAAWLAAALGLAILLGSELSSIVSETRA
jgi:hypothetical protein